MARRGALAVSLPIATTQLSPVELVEQGVTTTNSVIFGEILMALLKWAIILAVLAVIAAVLGFGGLAAGLAGVAKVLFFLFLAGVVILVIMGVAAGRKLTGAGDTDRALP